MSGIALSPSSSVNMGGIGGGGSLDFGGASSWNHLLYQDIQVVILMLIYPKLFTQIHYLTAVTFLF